MSIRREWNIARRGAWVMVAWVVLGGCYASAPALEDPESGTRLRRQLWRTEAGEETFIGWHDSELDARCRFSKAADGVLRCLPGDSLWNAHFLDADCTAQPVVPARCAEGEFRVRAASPVLCGGVVDRSEVLEVGDEVIAAERLFMRRDGECVSVDPVDVRSLTPVDPARFVAGEISRDDDLGGPLAYDRLNAEDGATGPAGLRDRARDTQCWLVRAPGAERMACLPFPSLDTLPGGPDCEQRWATNTSDCEPPELAYGFTRNECGEQLELEVYRLGAQVPESERMLGEACAGTRLEGELLRTERDDDAVPWLHRSHRGTGRLRPTVWTDDAGRALIAHPSYLDTELDVHCQPVSTTAGPRCLPVEALPRTYRRDFADETCTQPALSVGLCGPPTFVAYEEETDACSTGFAAVYRVGDPIVAVYSRHPETGACERLPEATGFALELLPLESLAPLERVIE